MKTSRLYQILFGVLVVAYTAYGGAFIQRTAILVDGEEIHALFDDAMISMQYAKNLANGDGLVWNAGGQPVEGYSNPLWVLLMAGIHLLPIPLPQTSFYLKLLSLVFLLLNLVMVKKIAEQLTDNKLVPLLAAFLTAFYFPLNNWSLQGMEVGLQALLINMGLLLALQALRTRAFSYWPYLVFALAILLRMDSAAPAIAATAVFAWIDKPRRKLHLQWGLGAIGATLLGLTIFRLVYYGDWLPNTYYLKLGGMSTILRISLGLRRFWDFAWNSNWVLFALPLALLALDKRKLLWPLYGAFIAQVSYSIYVGGDAWEHVGGANRFIASVMPIFFVLFAQTLGLLADLILRNAKFNSDWPQKAGQTGAAIFAIASLFSFNNLLVNNPIAKWTLQEKPVFTDSVERYALMGLTLHDLTAPDAVIAVITAGNIPYFSERTCIDLLGKNDRFIASGPMRVNSSLFEPGDFRPGHNKWDYAYSIGELHPDVVAQIWEGTEEEAAPYLVNYERYVIDGIPYYFLVDSEYILWELIPTQN